MLSEFAGAAVELHGALLVNPYDRNAMSATLYHALTMGADEVAYRSGRMAAIVRDRDVARWGDDFLAALAALPSSGHDDGQEERSAA